MSKPKKPTPPLAGKTVQTELGAQYQTSQKSMRQFRDQWEEFLDIAYARLSGVQGYKSRVREGTLSSVLWERTARVVAQLPTGKIQALNSRRDIGKSLLMDVVWHKYIIPGANTDYSFFTKVRLWDYYSFVYGAMPAFYDYRIDDEYTGPDFKILDPRYVYPQAGRLSAQSCEYIFVSAYHSKSYLKGKIGQTGWDTKVINQILTDWTDENQPNNVWKITNLQNDRGQTADLHKGEIELVTKYTRGKNGRWITFAPAYGDAIVRDIPNPHKSGRIPIVFKFCFPLLDSLFGMGDVERGASLQKAVDTYVNLSMDFAKFKLYPPMYYVDGVNASQLRYEPAAKWKLPSQNSVGFMEVSNSPTGELTQGYQFLKGALMNQNGTTQVNLPGGQDGDLQQGKTPDAIQQNQQRENSRDNWDRNMLEEAYSELANGMINLVGTKQPAAIDFHIFEDDIKKIYDAGNKDVLEVFDSAKDYYVDEAGELQWRLNGKGAAKVTISPADLKGEYRYTIDPGTTVGSDDKQEHQNLTEIIQFIGSQEGQTIVQGLQSSGRNLDYNSLFKKWLITSGVKDWEEIIPEVKQAQSAQGPQQFNPSMLQDPQTQQMYQQMQSQQQQQMQQEIQTQAQALAKQMIAQQPKKSPAEMINYQNAPPMTKAQMEMQAGLQPDPIHEIEEKALIAQHVASMQQAANPQPTTQVQNANGETIVTKQTVQPNTQPGSYQ